MVVANTSRADRGTSRDRIILIEVSSTSVAWVSIRRDNNCMAENRGILRSIRLNQTHKWEAILTKVANTSITSSQTAWAMVNHSSTFSNNRTEPLQAQFLLPTLNSSSLKCESSRLNTPSTCRTKLLLILTSLIGLALKSTKTFSTKFSSKNCALKRVATEMSLTTKS